MSVKHMYIAIDLKTFYASVECVERGLDPFTTNLVVADPDRSVSTICLAITPAMKKLGIRNRCRIHEIPDHIEYIVAKPRMQLYMEYSARIYGIYLNYVAKERYPCFTVWMSALLDVTRYLSLYHLTAKEMATKTDGCGHGRNRNYSNSRNRNQSVSCKDRNGYCGKTYRGSYRNAG